MSTDRLRIESNERVDISDFQHLALHADSEVRESHANFFTNPDKTKVWILEGFGMSNPAAKQLQVDIGRAMLAKRLGGITQYGVLAVTGDASKVVDMNTYSPGTYGIYIRFEEVEGETQSRIFWDPAGDGNEYTKSIATRYQPNWSVRVESSNPGSEWMYIGQVDQASMSILDQREFYFEGQNSPGPTPYQSGWSSDGGGSANDRNGDRALYGISDFQTFTGAMRQCIEDIKGRGLRRWWERDIGGMNIGFDGVPTADRLAIGDADHYIDWSSGPVVLWQWDVDNSFRYDSYEAIFKIAGSDRVSLGAATLEPLVSAYDLGTNTNRWRNLYLQNAAKVSWGADDYLVFYDATNQFQFWADGTEKVRIEDTGVKLSGGLNVGVGYGTAIETGTIRLFDSAVKMAASSSDFFLYMDTNDYFWYDRDWDSLNLYVNSSLELTIEEDLTRVYGEFYVNGGLISMAGTVDPRELRFDTGDRFLYNRATSILEFQIGSATMFQVESGGKFSTEGGLYVGTLGGSVTSGGIKADSHITTLGGFYGTLLNVNAGAPGYIDGHRLRISDYVQIKNVVAEGADKGLLFWTDDGTANEERERLYHTADEFIIAGEKDDGSTTRAHLTFVKNNEGFMTDLIVGDSANAPIVRPSYDWDGILGSSSIRWSGLNCMYVYGNRLQLTYEGDNPYYEPYFELRNENATYNTGRFRLAGYGAGLTWRSYMYDNDSWSYKWLDVLLDTAGTYKYEVQEITLEALDWVTIPNFLAISGQNGGARSGYVVYTGYYSAPGGTTSKAVVGLSGGNNDGWIKVYVNGDIRYIPYWSST